MLTNMLKQYLLSPTCLKCGSFFCDDSFFCEICFNAEIAPRVCFEWQSHLAGFGHYYLLEWNKGESAELSQMVYRLKSDNSRQAWAFYAGLFYKMLKNNVDFKNYQALIPIPSAKQSSTHAKIFAQELSALSNLPVLDVLSKNTPSAEQTSEQPAEQKALSAKQRKEKVYIELKGSLSEDITKFIFVDDILTTGESFLQSNRAVNRGSENLILSLFYRPKFL